MKRAVAALPRDRTTWRGWWRSRRGKPDFFACVGDDIPDGYIGH